MEDKHLHLSGAVHPLLIWEIICETGLKIKQKSFDDFLSAIRMKDKVNDLDSYLQLCHMIDEVQNFPSAIERSVYNAFVNTYLKKGGYLELRWNVWKRSRNFTVDFDRLIQAAISGMNKAKSYFGIRGGMIISLGRDVSMAANKGMLKKAIQYKDKGIIGIDLAGPYKGDLNKYVPLYAEAKKHDLLTTIHAGEIEYDDLEQDLETILTKIKPDRIGHGIKLVKFPGLLKEAAKQEIELEICLTSNLTTKAVSSLEEFATIFKALEEERIKYSINTDSIYPLQTNILKEHELFENIKSLSRCH